ncbi:hypothetical protein [Mycobacterium montefiorense]|uniref:PPE family C-terminal domain-containing protein n=1 Tax=Mycobacterium montefiorense TaxID=154654 RepID=A0AA37UM95_9MYCO|nr:hypothetical protein [Mycobacterium montefiorense]GBG38276.1 hypothetical protein MmonteBS_26480 [Mycobacterium montefiorense]GKU36168.1 hypothetical protein NJB14191_35140 [Mycobacterium montefiorense]GKU38723.1 hypothetical protein NJB14192_07200 [Mycobacterium montefiorense]GKU48239.1 hypothetical protein NJB14194_48540 [Mycobacterium montefiorense]GKU53912.1 hypothetical protein NJB14195_51530 [Mycobacterium montefiorense]
MDRVESHGAENPPAVKAFRDFSSVSVQCTTLGASASLGSLSVPAAWPTSTAKATDAPTAATDKPPGLTYQDGLMGVVTGSGTAAPA